MASPPTALLIDEGELDLVRAMLDELQVDYVSLRASKLSPPLPEPRCLLVTTATVAIEQRLRRTRSGDKDTKASWLAMVQHTSRMQRSLLRQAGFDWIVPRNVHPSALLLMLRRAVFAGANTQRGARVAVGQEIAITAKLRQHRAVLVDLSPSGCRLLTLRRFEPNTRLALRLPVPTGGWLYVRGRIVRAAPGSSEGGAPGHSALGVRFEPFRRSQREKLKAILRERVTGPAEPSDPGAPESVTAGPKREAAPDGSAPRAIFDQEVTAICDGQALALIGRDLSEDGMLVEPNAALKLGERVCLALHGDQREEPFLIEARVARNDGRRGLELRFDRLDSEGRQRLRRLIAGLPKIYALEDETPTITGVLTQLLSRRPR